MRSTLPACTSSSSAPRVSAMGTESSGRCSWYRSMRSMPSRRRLSSQAWATQRALAPPRPSPSDEPNLVATMASSRRPASALPRNSSERVAP